MNATDTNTTALDNDLAVDVALVLINTREFYEQTRQLRLNYSAKMANGEYRDDLAMKGLLPHVRRFIQYNPIFKRDYCDPKTLVFSTATYTAIVRQILEHYEEEIRDHAEDL